MRIIIYYVTSAHDKRPVIKIEFGPCEKKVGHVCYKASSPTQSLLDEGTLYVKLRLRFAILLVITPFMFVEITYMIF